MSERTITADVPRGARSGSWDDADDHGQPSEPPVRVLSRQEAQALIARQPSVSPWVVVAVQAVVGVVAAVGAWLLWGQTPAAWSALYGAAVVVVPGALMARGMTSRVSSMNAGTGAVSFMLWEMVKIGVSVAMLMLAPKLVQHLNWLALLAALVLCIKVYWVALLWRGR